MSFLYSLGIGENRERNPLLSEGELKSLIYHDIFDYPLTEREVVKWTAGSGVKVAVKQRHVVEQKNGMCYLKGNEGVVYKRLLKKRISARKIQMAQRAAKLLSVISTIKMVAITGSLAMENAPDDSDIDLLIVTKNNTLWTTRLLTLVLLKLAGIPTRRYKDKNQKDKLCINIWLDEGYLIWPTNDRNPYTAHEIAQIKPVVNKDSTYEKLIAKNSWLRDYWPNSVKVVREKQVLKEVCEKTPAFEKFAYRIQYRYMKPKMTREVATFTRAIFHPHDWGKIVLRQLTP